MNLTNPKAALFFLTFLLQFLSSGRFVVAQALLLATIPVVLNIAWLMACSVLLSRFVAVPRRSDIRRLQERLLGVVFIGFGPRLAAAWR